MPTAEEVFEGKPEKVWLLLKTIFEIIAMHDVKLLMPKIVIWINERL